MTSEQQMLDLELPQRYRPNTISGLCEATGWEDWRLLWPDIENWPASTALKIYIPASLPPRSRDFTGVLRASVRVVSSIRKPSTKFIQSFSRSEVNLTFTSVSLCVPAPDLVFLYCVELCKKPSKISQSRRRPLLALSHWSHLHYAKQAPKHGN